MEMSFGKPCFGRNCVAAPPSHPLREEVYSRFFKIIEVKTLGFPWSKLKLIAYRKSKRVTFLITYRLK